MRMWYIKLFHLTTRRRMWARAIAILFRSPISIIYFVWSALGLIEKPNLINLSAFCLRHLIGSYICIDKNINRQNCACAKSSESNQYRIGFNWKIGKWFIFKFKFGQLIRISVWHLETVNLCWWFPYKPRYFVCAVAHKYLADASKYIPTCKLPEIRAASLIYM